ncbi:TetR/AcrR family transcriptional regulator [Flagellimonas sp. 389]|uniref:TetR/AcrR family transcriptional regulator n=1 Tax=Flagellimonas sp. 389 TaxID=2835862 RepID=UPI001BD5232D|nr:TetR/AcrR family transcriptional regulator [Flagellimonas sp. 389]MBS9463355.1 TetR/AcrR family transcriptional regulator [Flagellimonas sp. 389]
MEKNPIHQKIITVAGELFYTNGYNSSGVNEIIAKCGIAKATLYSHFRSKEAICLAYLQQRHDTFLVSLKDYVAKRKKGKNQLLAIFDFLIDMYREGDFYGCWGLKTLGELSPNQKNIFNAIQKQKTELLSYLGDVVKDNVINVSKAETEKISGGLYLLYESAITESHLFKNDWPIFMSRNIAPSIFSNFQLV